MTYYHCADSEVELPIADFGPMAEFDEAAVQAWLAVVPGLAAAERAAASARMAEDEYEGAELVSVTAKTLRRVMKGSGAEDAVPALLAARDTFLAAEKDQQQAAAKTASPAPGCQICFEPYGEAAVPRILACGHTFCGECLSKMLRCASLQACLITQRVAELGRGAGR